MSGAPAAGTGPAAGAWPMYRAMVGVALLCGALIVVVFQATRPIIERNRAEALQRAIFDVLPGARSKATFRLNGGGSFELHAGGDPGQGLVYAGYDEAGRLVGLAVEAQGMGYQDVIHVLYGYSSAADAIVGIRVLESRETPGLGDRIETDAAFLENFRRLDVSLTEDLAAVAHPIEFVKHGQKQQEWQIDGITGATISSSAIAAILRTSTSFWVPRIRRGLDDFRRTG